MSAPEGKVAVVIPALDEEETIGKVLGAIPAWVDTVVVSDNGSKDATARIAAAHGAVVVHEPRRGYGRACMAGLAALAKAGRGKTPDVVVFLDGDFSDDPEQIDQVAGPALRDEADLVIGSRVMGRCEKGALTLTQRFGNRLSCVLTNMLFGVRYTDLGPFRAVRYGVLDELGVTHPGYGWTIQMQVRAARRRKRIAEVPVSCRRRAGGRSKISRTLRGVAGAGSTILAVIAVEGVRHIIENRAGSVSRPAARRLER